MVCAPPLVVSRGRLWRRRAVWHCVPHGCYRILDPRQDQRAHNTPDRLHTLPVYAGVDQPDAVTVALPYCKADAREAFASYRSTAPSTREGSTTCPADTHA